MKLHPRHVIAAVVVLPALLAVDAARAADEEAARALARQSGCFKCHAVSKKMDGPSYKEVAAKYRGKPDAQARLTEHITSGKKVKLEDGSEEEHKVVKTKDPAQIRNLVDWILSL